MPSRKAAKTASRSRCALRLTGGASSVSVMLPAILPDYSRGVRTDSLTEWLLDSDPALRWQVERDLLREAPGVWEATRARVATEGFGAQLLSLQDADGQWAGGAFFPADFDDAEDGQPW